MDLRSIPQIKRYWGALPPQIPRLGGGPEGNRPRPQGGTKARFLTKSRDSSILNFLLVHGSLGLVCGTAALDLCAGRWSSTNLVLCFSLLLSVSMFFHSK